MLTQEEQRKLKEATDSLYFPFRHIANKIFGEVITRELTEKEKLAALDKAEAAAKKAFNETLASEL